MALAKSMATSFDNGASRPRRSCLYMPGTNARAHEKAKSLAADVLIFDLEDSVAPAAKVEARARVMAAIGEGGYGGREIVVRVNAMDSPWAEDDLRAAAGGGAHGVILPKVAGPDDIRRAADLLDREGSAIGLWSMMETARAILAADEIAAAHERLALFTMGLEDLAKELGADGGGARLAMLYALERCVLAARANGLGIIDAVFPDFDDDAGLTAACAQGRGLGFDGKQLIHPRQIDIANTAFGPTGEAVAEAGRVIEAFAEAEREGAHVAVLDGRMIEALHAEAARRLVAFAEAIASLEES